MSLRLGPANDFGSGSLISPYDYLPRLFVGGLIVALYTLRLTTFSAMLRGFLVYSPNYSSSDWGACVPNQPTTETCGPQSPDLNCDGVVGNGSGCTIVMSIFADYTPECIEADGKLGRPLPFKIRATGANPGGWSWVTSFRVFTSELPGTVALRNCSQETGSVQGPIEYVQIGDACTSAQTTYTVTDLGVAGYVSTSNPGSGYQRLEEVTVEANFNPSGYHDVAYVPMGVTQPDGCTFSNSNFYAPNF